MSVISSLLHFQFESLALLLLLLAHLLDGLHGIAADYPQNPSIRQFRWARIREHVV